MLVTFKTKSYANIVMFGDVGTKMLELMNYGTSIPGAITAEDVSPVSYTHLTLPTIYSV